MTCKVIINTANAAFGDSDSSRAEEVARLLREIAEDLDNGEVCGPVIDLNGNKVGTWDLG
jgi:hypothetical protein